MSALIPLPPTAIGSTLAPCPAPVAEQPVACSPEAVRELVEILQTERQVEMPLTHHFAPGIYQREIFMPAGTFVIGHEHRTEHFNIVLTGRATVLMEGEKREIAAPACFRSGAGVQKLLSIHEDMRWITVHANPDDETDIAKLEERLLNLPAEFLAGKGNRTIDDFRMSLSNQLQETNQP